MLLMIDNYDSFTYNLVQYFSELKCDVIVKRNDKITIDEIKKLSPKWIVISPGPCTPDEAGISLDIIKELGDKFPILGVCLGHQAIAQSFGATIIHADEIMHGKVSDINHSTKGIFDGIKNPLRITRYHSLIADRATIPDCLDITSTLKDNKNVVMSIKHKELPIYGVQFHPESIMTESGHKMLENFLNLK